MKPRASLGASCILKSRRANSRTILLKRKKRTGAARLRSDNANAAGALVQLKRRGKITVGDTAMAHQSGIARRQAGKHRQRIALGDQLEDRGCVVLRMIDLMVSGEGRNNNPRNTGAWTELVALRRRYMIPLAAKF